MAIISEDASKAMINYIQMHLYADYILDSQYFKNVAVSNLALSHVKKNFDLLEINNSNKEMYKSISLTLDEINQEKGLSNYEVFSKLAKNNYVWMVICEESADAQSQRGHSFGEEFIYCLIHLIRHHNNEYEIETDEKAKIFEHAYNIFNEVLNGLRKENIISPYPFFDISQKEPQAKSQENFLLSCNLL